MPKVSVVIPVYGVEKYLHQCVNSLISQTLQDIEIILVNDGSTDKCPQICDEYAKKDSRIKVIHKENSGYGHSVNVGIDKAKGEYIGIIDSDDWIEPNMFESLYQKAIQMNADIVKSDFFKYSGLKNTNKTSNIIPQDLPDTLIKPTDYSSVMLIGPTIWTAIYKKEFLDKNNIRLLETPGASYQDTSFHFKTLLAAEKAYFSKQAFYHYRTDNASSSVKDMKKVFCVCDEWNEIVRWTKDKGIYNSLSEILSVLQYRTYMWNYKRLSGKAQTDFLYRFSADFKKLYEQGVITPKAFKKKTYNRLMEIIFHPLSFRLVYAFKHFPNYLLKRFRKKI